MGGEGVVVLFLKFTLENDGLFDEEGGGRGKQSHARVNKTEQGKAH